MKTSIQRTSDDVLSHSGSLDASASISGSAYSRGYARVVGTVFTDASSVAGSGLTVRQSTDLGQNWNYITACAIAACSACDSAFSIEIIGNAVSIEYVNGTGVASSLRALWYMRPI